MSNYFNICYFSEHNLKLSIKSTKYVQNNSKC